MASRPLTKPCLVRLAYSSAPLSPAVASSSGATTRAVGTRGRLLFGNSPGVRPTLQPSGFGNHLRKWETTATGEEKSGHIYAGSNETILFYDNLFPLKLSYGWMSYLVGRPWGADQDLSNLLQRFNKSSLGIADPINLVKRGIPKDDSLVIDTSPWRLALVSAFGQMLSRLLASNLFRKMLITKLLECHRNYTSTERWRSVRKI